MWYVGTKSPALSVWFRSKLVAKVQQEYYLVADARGLLTYLLGAVSVDREPYSHAMRRGLVARQRGDAHRDLDTNAVG